MTTEAFQKSIKESFKVLYSNPLTNTCIDFNETPTFGRRIFQATSGFFITLSGVFHFILSLDYLISGHLTLTVLEYFSLTLFPLLIFCFSISIIMTPFYVEKQLIEVQTRLLMEIRKLLSQP